MSRRGWAAAAAGAILLASASPASGANGVVISGSRVRITIPVDVRGAAPAGDVAVLDAAARRLARERLHGCFSVVPELVPSTGPDAHLVTVLAQRAGQFVRPTVDAGGDPYRMPRTLTVGSLGMGSGAVMAGPLPLLISGREPPTGRMAEHRLIGSVVHEAGAAPDLKRCWWSGTLELAAVYERYRLKVTASVPFEFRVDAAGAIDGIVRRSERAAVAEDPEVGHCEGSGLAMFGLRVVGRAENGRFALTFTPKGEERDFELDCDRGSVTIGGDYLRAVFLPEGKVTLTMNHRRGATATAKNTVQGRTATARVTIRPR